MHLCSPDGPWLRSFWAVPIKDAGTGFLRRIYSAYVPPPDTFVIFEGWKYRIEEIDPLPPARVSVILSVVCGSTRFLELEG
jgi:hypothetical protein